jgi:DNA-binding transcriptional regulator YiaG
MECLAHFLRRAFRNKAMTPDQFRAALADLGLSQADFARLAMVDARTVRRWCDGTRAVPGPVVALLGMMDKQRLTSP